MINLFLQLKVNNMKEINIIPIIWKEGSTYVSKCSELEIASAGDSPQEALQNLKEAVELYVVNAKALRIHDNNAPEAC